MNVGDLIRDARLESGLTQTQLARRSGTSQATLSAYESGGKVPSATTLARVLAAAGRRLTTVPAQPVLNPGGAELERRGRVFSQVLDLAQRLPARHANALRYPPIGPARDQTQ